MSKILLNEVYTPKIVPALKDPKKMKAISNHIFDYLDKNVMAFTTAGPIKKVLYLESDKRVIYDQTDIRPDELKAVLKKIPGIKSQLNIIKEPYYTMCAMGIKYAAETKDKDIKNAFQSMIICSMYPSLHQKYFRYEPNPDLMEFTINNLSKKFTIKQSGYFYAALYDIVDRAYELHSKRLIQGDDNLIIAYAIDIKTRLNSIFKNLAKEYYDNHKNNAYLSREEDTFEEDNYHEYDSNIYTVNAMTNKVANYLLSNGPNMTLVTTAAKANTVSVSELRNYANTIISREYSDDLKKIIESLLSMYLIDNRQPVNNINSNDFIVYSLNVYRTSNAKNQHIINVKKILDKWLSILGTKEKFKREATLNNFRRALYMLLILSIQQANIH